MEPAASTSAPMAAAAVKATPSSVLFRGWKKEGNARSRTLLLKVERPGPVGGVLVSQCFTPCFRAEVVGQRRDDGAPPVEEDDKVLLQREEVRRGTVLQLRITLDPPDEIMEVEHNFKDCIAIVAGGLVTEVPIYAIGKVKSKNGFEVMENLHKIRSWPKREVLGNLVASFLQEHRALPPTPSTSGHQLHFTTSSLPNSRGTALSSRSAGEGLEPDAFGRASLSSTVDCGTAGGLSMRSLGLTHQPGSVQQTRRDLPKLTSSDIAFEIDGVFYNTLGAEVGRLAETTRIFHLEEVEELGENGADHDEGGEELDLEESQVIADQQLIASQLVNYLNDGNFDGAFEQNLTLPSHSQNSSASTTRLNTPRFAAVAPLSPQDRNVEQAGRASNSSSAAGARPPKPSYEESPRSSRISQREMQANWDSIPGI
ncbi:hypothetical protein HKI87_17g85950 [Chloropicon roscoffensis]|uniref:Uncharacterized protein n=1 Tax=Chloropicon roscoffensis TaxID=1461544 RepID=A0AAX4PLV8_9CHLO